MNIHIKPIKCIIQDKYLYNNDNDIKSSSDVEIIGVSTYLGQTLTFHALINKQWLYSDLPITAFYIDNKSIDDYNLSDLSNVTCETLELDNFTFEHFFNKNISVYLKNKRIWVTGTYITSFDFYTGNELVHLVLLDNGLFGLFPNHKINFNNKTELPNYKKNKFIWKL